MKRGDYVIISGSEGQFTTASGKQNGVEAMIQHILMKDQINHIKKEGLWYICLPLFHRPASWEEETKNEVPEDSPAEEQEDEESSSDFDLGGNPNRRRFYVESESESESD